MSAASSFFEAAAVFAAAFFVKLARSPPACLMQSFTALRIASLVAVAPETASTDTVCPATIAAGICWSAVSEMLAVSDWLRIFTAVIFPSAIVTATVTSPFLPVAVAV